MSSRRSSHSKRRRVDTHRKSDASSFGDRRGSQPIVNFRPLDHPPGSSGLLPTSSQLPNYDPRIYDQLSTFTFGAPPGSSAPQSAATPTFNSLSHQTVPPIRRRSYSQSADDTDASVEEVDEEERMREERAKLRAMDDGSRRPSLPINFPPGAERRRSTIFRLANGMDNVHMDDVPEERAHESTSLPSRLEPKPLPALPLTPFHALHGQTQLLKVSRPELRSQLEASAAVGGYDLSYIMEPESDTGSPKPASEASNAPSPQANGSDARESSPSGGVMESAGFQAILDHEWGTAFHIPANLSPRSSIMEDPFMKMVEQFDPVYNRNKYAWTFKKLPSPKKQANGATELRTVSEPPSSTPRPSAKGKEREREPEKEQPEVVMWNCQNVGQYGMWPGRSSEYSISRFSIRGSHNALQRLMESIAGPLYSMLFLEKEASGEDLPISFTNIQDAMRFPYFKDIKSLARRFWRLMLCYCLTRPFNIRLPIPQNTGPVTNNHEITNLMRTIQTL